MRHLFVGLALASSVLASSATFAAMDAKTKSTFVAMCQKQMYETAPVCGCMAGIADQTLDDLSIAYLNFSATDAWHGAQLTKKMTAAELHAVDNFMKTAPHKCAGTH
jgi:hypothetical protein